MTSNQKSLHVRVPQNDRDTVSGDHAQPVQRDAKGKGGEGITPVRERIQAKLAQKKALLDERLLNTQEAHNAPSHPQQDGVVHTHRRNGKTAAKLTYQKGLKNGVAEYYDDEGLVKKRLTFLNDQLHGDALYYKDGTVKTKVRYRQGRMDGDFELYRKGHLMAKIPHVDGLYEGVASIYDEAGHVISKISYKAGMRDGLCVSYDPLGRVIKTQTYVANKLEGDVKLYYPNGLVLMEYQVRQNKKEGPSVSYHKNGAIKRIEHYSNGKLLAPARQFMADGTEFFDA